MSQFGGFGCRVVNVTVAAALLATSPAAISQAYPPDESGRTSTPPPCPPDSSPAYRERTRCTPPTGDSSTGTTEDDSDDDGGAIVPVVVGVGLVGLLAASLFGSGSNSRGNKLPDRDWLLKNGPQLPTSYPVGSFSVKGLAKNGWPIVLDFMPQPRTRTTLDVIFKKLTIPVQIAMHGEHIRILNCSGQYWVLMRMQPALNR